jgi:hypothetical protein
VFAKLPHSWAQTLCERGQTLSLFVGLPGELKETLGLFAKSLYEEGEPLRAWVETL